MIGRYALNVAVAVDQLANAVLGGDCDETLSSRLGKAQRGDFGPGWRWITAPIRWAVDAVFRVAFGQSGHCASSIEEDEGMRDLLR
ncbi:hypothetical protein [Azospirillum sp.]|uniref:hypothetical protein n=1 Tax=Azospirillum sp. TaxID=34012 RepID=UPI002D47A1DB|nr:hypothetical protein [Azospirillum sp.]HYF87435.1 hypothetical protein [Azospirillum sp.]